MRNINTILAEIINRLIDNTDLSAAKTPGSVVRTLSEAIATYFSNIYEYITFISDSAYIDTAEGHYLDLIGAMFNLSRNNATYPYDYTKSNVYLYIDPVFNYTAADLVAKIPAGITSNNIGEDWFTIRRGTRLYNRDRSKVYSITEDVTFEGSDTKKFVNVIALREGSQYNIGANELVAHGIKETQEELFSIADYILVSNKYPITNGGDVEDDVHFRYRIKNAIASLKSAGEMHIRMAALSVPGVADVIIKRHANGIGTVNVLVIGTTPLVSDGVLHAVAEACNRVAAAGNKVTVTAPIYRTIHLCVDLVYENNAVDQTSIRNTVKTKIVDYINNTQIEGEIIFNRLLDLAINTPGVKDAHISCFSSGYYIRSTGEEIFIEPLAMTNQRAGRNEKFYTNYDFIKVC